MYAVDGLVREMLGADQKLMERVEKFCINSGNYGTARENSEPDVEIIGTDRDI